MHYFGSAQTFLERLCEVLEKPEVLRSLYVYEDFLSLLQEVDQDVIPALRERRTLLERLECGLWSLAHDLQAYSRNRSSAVALLGRLAQTCDERRGFEHELRGLLQTDPPWDLRRTALESLDQNERHLLERDLRTRLETNPDPEQ